MDHLKGYWTLLTLLSGGRFIAFVARMNIVPFYAELMAFYGATYTGAGALYTAFFVGYSLALIPAGLSADRNVPLRQIALGLLLLVGSSVALVVSPFFTAALAARVIEGIAVALIYTACLKLVAVSFTREHRGKAIGLMEIATGLGMVTALSIFPFLSRWFDYKELLLSLPVLAAGFLILLPFARAAASAGPASQKALPPLSDFLNRTLLLITVTSLLGLLTVNGVLGWIPTYLTDALDYTKAEAGAVTAVILGTQMLSVFPGGWLSDRLHRRLPLVQAGSVLILVSMLIYLFFRGPAAVYGASILMGIGMAWGITPLMVLLTETFRPERAGLVVSITVACSQGQAWRAYSSAGCWTSPAASLPCGWWRLCW
jgi:MFS family permease